MADKVEEKQRQAMAENLSEPGGITVNRQAVLETLRICRERDVLRSYLEKEEVTDIMFGVIDKEREIALAMEEYREDIREELREELREEVQKEVREELRKARCRASGF